MWKQNLDIVSDIVVQLSLQLLKLFIISTQPLAHQYIFHIEITYMHTFNNVYI